MSFDEIFKEMRELQKKMSQDMFRGFGSLDDAFPDIDALEKKIKSGEMEGDWSFEPIERPGMKGFIARGFFSAPGVERPPLDRPTDILPPLRPQLREPREPLYDVSVDGDIVTLFIELPGVEEKDVQLDVDGRKLNLKAGDFQAEIDLSGWLLKTDEMVREHRNGVLKLTIPKTKLDEQLI